jgi:hypothetical protein
VHNRPEINRADLGDPAPASQAALMLKSRSLSQGIERITTPIRQLIQFLRQRADRSREVASSHQLGVSDQSLILSDEFETRAKKLPVPDATPIIGATFIEAPRDGDLQALYQYWDTVRRGRVMPQRADIDPTEIPNLLPYVIVYAVSPGGGAYQIRLVGEEITHFVGQNLAGQLAGSFMTPRAAEMMNKILDAVAKERVPKFRAGKAYWHAEKTNRDFEACFLPLSSDGETANLILGGIKTGL